MKFLIKGQEPEVEPTVTASLVMQGKLCVLVASNGDEESNICFLHPNGSLELSHGVSKKLGFDLGEYNNIRVIK